MKNYIISIAMAMLFLSSGCRKFLDVGVPNSKIDLKDVFADEVTATSAVLGIYHNFRNGSHFGSGGYESIHMLAGMTSDELVLNVKQQYSVTEFEENRIDPDNAIVLGLWSSMYETIYGANVILEGLTDAASISDATKNQLNGECLFMRAFAHFYLVNTFGDVPLVINSDYNENRAIGRTPAAKVYEQIISDIESAVTLLPEQYAATGQERVRVNKYAAMAFAARVHLFTGNWSRAEELSSGIIAKTPMYKLDTSLNDVFLKNTPEAIWQIKPNFPGATGYTAEASVWERKNVVTGNSITKSTVSAFEPGDLRRKYWVDTISTQTDTLHYPCKYKQADYNGPLVEYSMVLRLAEQYLIRAEARARQQKLTGPNSAKSDIDTIRKRAGLLPTTAATEADIVAAVLQERRVELLSEWGHRWFDLKRTGKALEVISKIKPNFTVEDELFPLPYSEFVKNYKLGDQNPGYRK